MGYIGIDFGTCFSNAAIIENNQIIPLKVDGDDTKLASALFLENNNKFSIGKTAISNRIKDLRKFKKEFKRDFGETRPFNIGNKNYLPEELCKEVLKYIKIKAEERLSENINSIVITHPAKWSSYKKGLLEKAGFMAGFTEIRLLDEPTAAAIYYSQNENISDGEKILVYDLGGGTFDIALIEKIKDGFKQIAQPKGIERCGGIDFDKKILRNIKEKFKDNEAFNTMIASEFRFQLTLENEAIKLKHILSEQNEAMASIPIGFEFLDYHITREEFNSLIEEDIAKTCSLIKDIVNEANLKNEDIDRIILVGGSTRIPFVKEMIEKTIGNNKDKVFKNIDPDLAVCCGAVCRAKELIFHSEEIHVDEINYIELGDNKYAELAYKEAIEYYIKAIDVNSEKINIYIKMGQCYECEYEYDKAIECYDKIIGIEPHYMQAYNNLGYCYKRKGNYEEAINYYNKAVSIDPNNKYSHSDLGDCYSYKSKNDKAIECYKKVIQIDPNNISAHNNLINCFGKLSNYEKAIEYYKKTVKLDPENRNKYFINLVNNYISYDQIYKIYSSINAEDDNLLLLKNAYGKLLSITKLNDNETKNKEIIYLIKEFEKGYSYCSIKDLSRIGVFYCNCLMQNPEKAILTITSHLENYTPFTESYFSFIQYHIVADIIKILLDKDYAKILYDLEKKLENIKNEKNRTVEQNQNIETKNFLKKAGVATLAIGTGIAFPFLAVPLAYSCRNLNALNENLEHFDESLLKEIEIQLNNEVNEFQLKIKNVPINFKNQRGQ